jgi:putative transcriptional regulator
MAVPISNHFSKLLEEKEIKERRYISLAEVAKEIGVSRKTLYAWQNNTVNRFDREVIEALCEYFGVGLSELLEYSADEPQPKQKTAR